MSFRERMIIKAHFCTQFSCCTAVLIAPLHVFVSLLSGGVVLARPGDQGVERGE